MFALTPSEITNKTSETWHKKANAKIKMTIIWSILAGIYISLWWMFSVTSISWLSWIIPFGIIKVIAWVAFSLWLILVMVAWAELFTGNTLLSIALLDRKIKISSYIKNLSIVYIFNFVWSLVIVALLYFGWWHLFWDWIIWQTLYNIWTHKLEYGFIQALSLWILCNILVCLWVWLACSGKTVTDKIMGIIFPVTAFIAWWFEHSVANMFYLPFTYIIQKTWLGVDSMSALVTIPNIITKNLIPVTIWNIIWGGFFVWFMYWWLNRDKNEKKNNN